jgi:hypothetical protein
LSDAIRFFMRSSSVPKAVPSGRKKNAAAFERAQ